MWVICDNSTLSALAEIGWLALLPRILGPITIPASVAGEVEINEALDRLQATGFRLSKALIDDARAQVAARGRGEVVISRVLKRRSFMAGRMWLVFVFSSPVRKCRPQRTSRTGAATCSYRLVGFRLRRRSREVAARESRAAEGSGTAVMLSVQLCRVEVAPADWSAMKRVQVPLGSRPMKSER